MNQITVPVALILDFRWKLKNSLFESKYKKIIHYIDTDDFDKLIMELTEDEPLLKLFDEHFGIQIQRAGNH
jgi:hypothetical protein